MQHSHNLRDFALLTGQELAYLCGGFFTKTTHQHAKTKTKLQNKEEDRDF
jgi:hypothetical protein